MYHYISLSPWAQAVHDPRNFILTNFNPLSQRMILTSYQCIPGQWFMRRFFNIYQHFPYFAPYWAPKGASPFIRTNLNPLSQRIIHTKYQCILASGSREDDFWIFSKIFLILPLIGPKREASLFIWTHLHPHPPSMFPINFGWNWPIGSWEEDFLSISLLRKSLSPWGWAIHDAREFIWTNLNPLSQRIIHIKISMHSGQWFTRTRFWIFIKIFLILPLIGPAPLFEQI